MPSAETRIPTGNAATYIDRLCGHLSKLAASSRSPGHGPHLHAGGQPPAVLHAEHTHDTGTVTLTWGTLSLHAAADHLAVRADADGPDNLRRIQDMVTGRLLKFGRREHLDIRWHAAAGTAGGADAARPPAAEPYDR